MQLIISDLCTIKKVPPCCSFLPLLYIFLLNILTPTPTCPVTNRLSVTYASHPFLSFDLHPHTQCLSNPPCFFLSSFLLSFLLSVYPSLKQTAVTATWSSPRCGTSPRGWTSCRLRPSSPGRSYSLSTEASRMYVCLLASHRPWFSMQKRLIIQHSNISFLPWAGVSQWNGGWGDIQDHLFSVLSPRRSEIFSSLNILL